MVHALKPRTSGTTLMHNLLHALCGRLTHTSRLITCEYEADMVLIQSIPRFQSSLEGQETVLYMTNKNKQERNIYATLFLNLLLIRMKKTLLHTNLR
jgi:hypothetical protein